jgi:hypothetical protein
MARYPFNPMAQTLGHAIGEVSKGRVVPRQSRTLSTDTVINGFVAAWHLKGGQE